jgi:Pyruvate/2-oxoacid:ferredoxin oxidoreductase gamma subunit
VKIGLTNLNCTNGTKVYQIQIRKIAETLGDVRYMGVAALGAFATIDDRVNLSNLEKSIKSDSKLRRFVKENLYALQQGAKSVSLLK